LVLSFFDFFKNFSIFKNFNFLCIKVEHVKDINPSKLEKAGPSLPPDVNNFIQTINISGSDDPDEKLSEEESEINASGEKDSEKNSEIIESNNLGSEQQQDERNSEKEQALQKNRIEISLK